MCGCRKRAESATNDLSRRLLMRLASSPSTQNSYFYLLNWFPPVAGSRFLRAWERPSPLICCGEETNEMQSSCRQIGRDAGPSARRRAALIRHDRAAARPCRCWTSELHDTPAMARRPKSIVASQLSDAGPAPHVSRAHVLHK